MLFRNSVEGAKRRAAEKAKRDEIAMDDYIERIKSGEVSGRKSMTLAQIVDNYYDNDNAVRPYDEFDDTVIDPAYAVTATAGFDQFGR